MARMDVQQLPPALARARLQRGNGRLWRGLGQDSVIDRQAAHHHCSPYCSTAFLACAALPVYVFSSVQNRNLVEPSECTAENSTLTTRAHTHAPHTRRIVIAACMQGITAPRTWVHKASVGSPAHPEGAPQEEACINHATLRPLRWLPGALCRRSCALKHRQLSSRVFLCPGTCRNCRNLSSWATYKDFFGPPTSSAGTSSLTGH